MIPNDNPSQQSSLSDAQDNLTILVVDDEPETLKGYAEFLNPQETPAPRRSSRQAFGTTTHEAVGGTVRERYRLICASSGEEAVKLFEAEYKAGRRVAAGFFDVKLGAGMDGLATIHALQAIDPDIYCAVVTAYHDRSVDEIQQLFGEAFKDQWDYLNKPFTQGEIVQKARQMVAAWNRRRKLEALQKQLIRSERFAAIGQVARGVGHEFGNILLRIMGKADIALKEKSLERMHEHLQVILAASDRAAIIVRNLQSFSKAEPHFQMASPIQAIEQALSLLGHELKKANVEVRKKYESQAEVSSKPHARMEIRIDLGGLAQVFLNLFINAMHAMPKGGALEIEVDVSSPKDLVISVNDTGEGIPESVLPRIFDYAFTTKGDRGSGLGLSISREIIQTHGGEIEVKSTVGKGTHFTIRLPKSRPGVDA